MKPKVWKTVLASLLAALLLAGGAWRLDKLKELRRTYNLDPADMRTEAEMAARLRVPTVALSIFRSLAIDYLWIRADNLKQQGQYFDALHLARMICALQPNLPSVWKFQSWNMTYNISVAMPTASERWNWVMAGIELLRDQGLKACPGSADLYRELSWYFQHKLGGVSDTYHRYYKERLAIEMMQLVGPNGGTNEEFAALATAPRTWTDLLADPNVAAVMEEISRREPMLQNRENFVETWLSIGQDDDSLSMELRQYFMDNEESPALASLDRFIRAYRLRNHWKLEPDRILEINHRYGPVDYASPDGARLSLDWRLPWSQGVYWACQGIQYTKAGEFDQLQCWRMLYGNLQDMVYNGRLHLFFRSTPADAPERGTGQEIVEKEVRTELRSFTSQDLRMFPSAYKAMHEAMQAYIDIGEEYPKSIEDASEYLAWGSIESLYLMGRAQAAGRYYQELRKDYPDNPDYQLPLDEFIRTKISEEAEQISPRYAAAYVDSLLRQGHLYYAQGNGEMAQVFYARAQRVHDLFAEQQSSETDRVKLPELGEMALLAYVRVLTDPLVDPTMQELLATRLRDERPGVWDRIVALLQEQVRSNGQVAPSPAQ
ncbi:MAG: hypothetical protein JW741_13545 [Sedimentisphaerales bacterium]|nr:hypothetical protein [Sedimentisphaerales bacterium]